MRVTGIRYKQVKKLLLGKHTQTHSHTNSLPEE